MKSVIINADDFGLSDGICKSIYELFDCQAISSTSLMIAAPNAIETIRKWKGKSLLGFAGVHLQLTGGKPLSHAKEVRSLIDTELLTFRNPREGAPVDTNEVENEWRLQIKTAIDLLGGPPTHLDSHHGVHRIPELFDVYVKLANEFNIPMRGAISGIIRDRIEHECLRASVAIVREWTGKFLDSNNLINQVNCILDNNPNEKVLEIVSHPGYSDKYLKSISSLNNARENDHLELKKLAEKDWWIKAGYELISFNNIGNGFNRCN